MTYGAISARRSIRRMGRSVPSLLVLLSAPYDFPVAHDLPVDGRVDAGLADAVRLVAGQRGSEHANQAQVLILAAEQPVRVVLVERIDPSREDVVLGAVHLYHLAPALDAVASLEVVRVLDQGLGALVHDRVSHGVAHAVRREQETTAQSIAPLDRLHFIEIPNDHV